MADAPIRRPTRRPLSDRLNRPPLGLMPRKIWEERRIQAIADAMARYIIAGYRIPPEWIQEWADLNKWRDK